MINKIIKKLIKGIRLVKKKKNINEKGMIGFFNHYLKIFIFIYYLFNLKIDFKSTPNKNWFWHYKTFKSNKKFKINGRIYKYFYHIYNATWKTERTVEIPIIYEIVKRYYKKNILEVGNVLSNYFSVDHDVIDKYEDSARIIKQDVIGYYAHKKYDLIVSISTLEHIGWNETPQKPERILKAIEHLKGLITPNGKIVITLPIGWNHYLDKILDIGKIKFSKQIYLKQISKSNKWKEVKWHEIRNSKYGIPVYKSASGLVIGFIEEV